MENVRDVSAEDREYRKVASEPLTGWDEAKVFGPPIVSAVLGFAGAWLGSQLGDYRKSRQERASVLAAFQAEISVMQEVIARRNFVELLGGYIRKLEGGQNLDMPKFHIQDDGLTVWPVYKALADKVGVLNADQAREITTFYACIRAIRASFGEWLTGKVDGLTPAQKADVIRGELRMYSRATTAAARVGIRADLKEVSAKPP